MNADYKMMLDRYRRELSDLEGKRAVCMSKITGLQVELNVAEDITDAELEAMRADLEAKRVAYEAKLGELVAELDKING